MNLFSKKNKQPLKTIAIRSTDRGMGTTHVSICFANSLAMQGYRVALIEWNQQNDFAEIEKSFKGYGYESGNEQSFRIRKVDYYKNYQERGLASLKKENYDFLIADIGNRRNSYFEEVDFPVLLVNGCEWKASRYAKDIREMAEKIGNRLKVIVNFGNTEEIQYFRKSFSGNLYTFPFWKDAFASDKEQREWVWKIVRESM